ncbi:hypothetical protein AB0G20_28500 [Streptomyces sp. NPDC024017]|uniref:hypothetical protein n=1 Tax=Streptomyces sp. NPDC024017 TaxID=3154326 RepID=UPI0033DCE14D
MIASKMVRQTAALASAAAALLMLGTVEAQAATAASSHGCPDGAFCIYPENTGFNNDVPSHVYWSRGVHQLSNQYGIHMIYNNQTDGWKADICVNSNGTNCWTANQGYANEIDLTPINSVVLRP